MTQVVDSTSETTQSGINDARSVMHASLTSFAKIWAELESSASKIKVAVTSAMVKNVEYKYGRDAGDAANLAIGAVASIGETAFTLDNIGAKVIADVGNSGIPVYNDSKPLEPNTSQDEANTDNAQAASSSELSHGDVPSSSHEQ